MPTKFVSNGELRSLLDRATIEERLALTQTISEAAASALSATELQQQICMTGGHGVANCVRGQGTGYIDIVSDVASGLKIPRMSVRTGNIASPDLGLWIRDQLSLTQTDT